MTPRRSQVPVFGIRLHRLHGLIAAGLVDSFGLALGWTVFNLYALTNQGLATVGIYNAAMLIGIALSAPATAFLSTRLDGRSLLQTTAVAEAVLRVGSFVLLLHGAPVAVVVCVIALMHVLAWSGYAGMRAEVAAVSSKAAAMTWYIVCIASIEAAGAAGAAFLPVGSSGTVTGPLLGGVIAVYAACLVPQVIVGRTARVLRSARERTVHLWISRRAVFLGGGFAVMLLASGPTLLSVGLAVEFHGRSWVAAAAVAFTIGSLTAPLLAGALERSRLSARVTWPWLGAGMIAGWVLAPWHPGGLLLAQVLAGLCMTTFEGTMDARAAANPQGSVTASLAWGASARALGSAVAVALIPLAITVSTFQVISAAAAAALVAAGVMALTGSVVTAMLLRRRHRRPEAALTHPSVGALLEAFPILSATAAVGASTNRTEQLAPVLRLEAPRTTPKPTSPGRTSPDQRLAPVIQLDEARPTPEPISPELVLIDPELAARLRGMRASSMPLRSAAG